MWGAGWSSSEEEEDEEDQERDKKEVRACHVHVCSYQNSALTRHHACRLELWTTRTNTTNSRTTSWAMTAATAMFENCWTRSVFCTLSLFKTPISTWGKSKGEGGGSPGRGKGEGPRENLQKVRVLRIPRGVGVVPSRLFRGVIRT